MTLPVLNKVSLEARHISLSYGATEVLRDVNLRVEPGEFFALLGPSGSGKSTLLNLAGGLDRATSGRVLVQGAELGTMGQDGLAALRRRAVGFVFQDFNLVGSLTAAENIGLPLELDGLALATVREKALEALTEIGLADVSDRFPDEMSGGQRQRVAIARALIGSRTLVLADEPTGAVDSVTGEAILRLLRSRIDAGAAGLLVTHEPRHAAWADRVIYLRDGRIVDDLGAVAGSGVGSGAGASTATEANSSPR